MTTNHIEGSRKQKVHICFDAHGQDAAWVLGTKLRLSPNSLRSWFCAWRKEAPKAKVKSKPKTKAKKKAEVAQAAA